MKKWVKMFVKEVDLIESFFNEKFADLSS